MRWGERRDILLQEGCEGERQTSPLYPLLASRARLEPCSTAAVEVGLPALLPRALLLSEEESDRSDCSNLWHPEASLLLSSISNLGARLFLQQAWQIVQDAKDRIINTAIQKRCTAHLLRVHFPSLKKKNKKITVWLCLQFNETANPSSPSLQNSKKSSAALGSSYQCVAVVCPETSKRWWWDLLLCRPTH